MDHVELVRRVAKSMELVDENGHLVLDSLTTIDFVMQLEQEAHVEIQSTYMTRENFATLESVAALLAKLAG